MSLRTLIIGYGSTLRRDDGVGYLVAERLMETLGEDNVIARQQLTPDLADDVANFEQVIFIDACVDLAPGVVEVRPISPSGANWGAFVHEMSPAVLLDCVKELYSKTPRAHLIAIGGEDFSIGEGLTPTVEEAIQSVLGHVQAMLAQA